MEQLHREADKLTNDASHLQAVIDDDVDLALSIAKRVRRTSTILVRELARLRDQSQPGGTD